MSHGRTSAGQQPYTRATHDLFRAMILQMRLRRSRLPTCECTHGTDMCVPKEPLMIPRYQPEAVL
jgi:hypothetical protein